MGWPAGHASTAAGPPAQQSESQQQYRLWVGHGCGPAPLPRSAAGMRCQPWHVILGSPSPLRRYAASYVFVEQLGGWRSMYGLAAAPAVLLAAGERAGLACRAAGQYVKWCMMQQLGLLCCACCPVVALPGLNRFPPTATLQAWPGCLNRLAGSCCPARGRTQRPPRCGAPRAALRPRQQCRWALFGRVGEWAAGLRWRSSAVHAAHFFYRSMPAVPAVPAVQAEIDQIMDAMAASPVAQSGGGAFGAPPTLFAWPARACAWVAQAAEGGRGTCLCPGIATTTCRLSRAAADAGRDSWLQPPHLFHPHALLPPFPAPCRLY